MAERAGSERETVREGTVFDAMRFELLKLNNLIADVERQSRGHGSTVSALIDAHEVSRELATALRAGVDVYCALANSGDCGNWNPEEEPHIIAARAALAKAEGR